MGSGCKQNVSYFLLEFGLSNANVGYNKIYIYRGDRGKMIHLFEIFFPAFMTRCIQLLLDVTTWEKEMQA